MGRRLIREPQVLERVGVGRTKFDEDYVKTGRVEWVRIGKRIKALPEDEVDKLVDEIIEDWQANRQAIVSVLLKISERGV